MVRKQGHVLMTVPNYDLDMGSNDAIAIGSGAGKAQQRRSRKQPVEVVDFERKPTDDRRASLFRRGLSRLRHLVLVRAGRAACRASRAASPPIISAGSASMTAATSPSSRKSATSCRKAIEAGFMINPVAVPVRWGKDDLSFGFNFDASNPPFADYLVRFYGDDGKALGEYAYHKDFIGAVLIEDVVRQWNGADAAKVATALVAPDHLKIGLAPQRLVTTADMLVRHLQDRRPGLHRVPELLAQPRRRRADPAALAASLDRRHRPHQCHRPGAHQGRVPDRRLCRECQRQSRL